MKKSMITDNKRLVPFIAPGAKASASEQEIRKRLVRIERAMEIGQDLTRVDSENSEIENPYRVQALIYIMNDQEVPDDLRKQIKKFDAEYDKLKGKKL